MPTWYRPARSAMVLARVRISRRLAHGGKVLVKAGTRVGPHTPIATRVRRQRLAILSIGLHLHVPPQESLRFLRVRPGDTVDKGDILAEKPGLFRRRLTAPFPARVLYIGHDRIVLQQILEEETLVAGVSGDVEEVLPRYGAVLTATGAFLEGLWGNGKIDAGLAYHSPAFPRGALESTQVVLEHRGTLLLAQTVASPDVFSRGEEVGIKGLVLAFLEPEWVDAAKRAPYPVLVVEGFTEQPFSPPVLQVLHLLHQRDAILCAEPPKRATGQRPWLFSPQEAYEALHSVRSGAPLEPNTMVRILRGPHRGKLAHVLELKPEPEMLPSGTQSYVVKLRFDEQTLVVPITNVEIAF